MYLSKLKIYKGMSVAKGEVRTIRVDAEKMSNAMVNYFAITARLNGSFSVHTKVHGQA